MELASMLAGEPFSDKPRSVSPVIAGFLRAYNDRLDDEWRQDLYPYAARVVGTAAPKRIERERARYCVDWTMRMGGKVPLTIRWRPSWFDGSLAVDCLAGRPSAESHREALALVDHLIALSRDHSGIPSDLGALCAPQAREARPHTAAR